MCASIRRTPVGHPSPQLKVLELWHHRRAVHVRAAQDIALCLPVRSSPLPAALAPSSTCLGPPLLLLTRRGSFISASCRSMEHMPPWTPSTRDVQVGRLLLDATTVSCIDQALHTSPRHGCGGSGPLIWPRRSRAASSRSVCYDCPKCLGGQRPEPKIGHLRPPTTPGGKLVTRCSNMFWNALKMYFLKVLGLRGRP